MKQTKSQNIQLKPAEIESATPPSFIYRSPTTPVSQSDVVTIFFKELSWNHASIIIEIIIFVLLIVIIFILYIRTKKQKCTQIVLEITTGSECVTLPVMNLPLCPSYFTIDAPDDIFNVELSNFTKSKLFVQWPGFVITNSLTKQRIHVKQDVRLVCF